MMHNIMLHITTNFKWKLATRALCIHNITKCKGQTCIMLHAATTSLSAALYDLPEVPQMSSKLM